MGDISKGVPNTPSPQKNVNKDKIVGDSHRKVGLTQWSYRGKVRDLPGAVKGPVYIGHVHERVELLGLLAGQDEGLNAEDLAYGVEPLILLQPLLAANFYIN